MIRLFEPLMGQTVPLGTHYILTTREGLVLERVGTEYQAVQAMSWWRTRCGLAVALVVLHITAPALQTLSERLAQAPDLDTLRRILDVENRRTLAALDFGEA